MRILTSLVFFFFGLLIGSCSRQQPARTSVFQVRLVQDRPTADTEEMTILGSPTDVTSTTSERLNVQKDVLLDHTAVASATIQRQNPSRAPVIEVVFTEKGRKLFADITRQNVGKRLAMVVDGRLLFAPRVEAEVPGGRAFIYGAFSVRQASELAAKLNDAARNGRLQPERGPDDDR